MKLAQLPTIALHLFTTSPLKSCNVKCHVVYSTVQYNQSLQFSYSFFIFLHCKLWGGGGSVKCEEWDASLAVLLCSIRGGYILVCLESLRERLKLLTYFGFFYIHHLRNLWKFLPESHLLITGPFTQCINGLRWLYCCQCLLCQCFLLPLSINIGFAIPVLMGKGWALLYVKAVLWVWN